MQGPTKLCAAALWLAAATWTAAAQEPTNHGDAPSTAEAPADSPAEPATPGAEPAPDDAAREDTASADADAEAPASSADGGPAPTTASASDPPAESAGDRPAETARPATLDTIEVTALRRTERLQEVPVAVTALTRDQVEMRGVQRLDDLNSLAPGLQISRSPSNTTISQITIRASSQINPAIYWDPAVGVYLDNVYIGKGQGAIFDIVDLAGVEVLRGPQGTLYGRNTIAGTINFVTREPSGVFSGNAALEFGNYNAQVRRASIDLPHLWIADITLGVRSERRDGWVDEINDQPVDEFNDRHNDGLHLAANLALWPGVEGLYRYDRSKIDQTNNYLQLYRNEDPRFAPYVFKERQTRADVNGESFERSHVDGHSFTLTWNVDDANAIKSISGYRKVRWEDSLDLDGSPMTEAHTQRFTDYEQKSQDLNLTGAAGAFDYVVGAYYFSDDGYTNNPQTFKEGGLNFDSRYGTHTTAWAGYGQLDWQVLDVLTLTGGLRYTRESKRLDRVLGVTAVPEIALALGAPIPLPAPGQPFVYYMPEGFTTPEETFTATTPLASIAWQVTESLNTYLRYAEGFKSGGFNGEYSALTRTPEENRRETSTPFQPERQKSLELGIKSAFFDGRAVLNLAAFRNQLTDLQIAIFGTEVGAAATVVRNAGKATVEGIELESAFIPWDGTELRANYAWLKPEYDEFLDAGANRAGNRAFVHAPEHSYNLVLDSRLLETRWGTLRAVADYAWTDRFYTYPYQLEVEDSQKQVAGDTEVQAHGILNARLAWSGLPVGAVSTVELALWGRNLLDEDTVSNFIDFGPGVFQSLTCVNYFEPRTLGVAGILRW